MKVLNESETFYYFLVTNREIIFFFALLCFMKMTLHTVFITNNFQ